MDEEKRKNLEGKLKAIQDLKSEHYIGTQASWKYLNRVIALYENPKKVSRAINVRVAEQRTVYYPASPERVLGLLDFLFLNLLREPKTLEDSPIFYYHQFLCGNGDKVNLEKLTDFLIPIFANVQEPDTSNDVFGNYALVYSLENLDCKERKRKFFMRKFTSVNWDYVFSLENLRKIERDLKMYIFYIEINIIDRIKLMERDQVDHRLENRREILADWIHLIRENNPKIDYESLLEEVRSRYKMRQDRLKRLRDLNAHDAIISNEIRLVKEYEFINRLIKSEKNFINRFLKS